MTIQGVLICLIPAALGVVLYKIDDYLETHPEFIKNFKKRLRRQ